MKNNYKIIPGEGDPCPRCKRPAQIREHLQIKPKHLSQAYYFSRWFNCTHADCQTTLFMAERFKVMPTAQAAE